MELCDEAKIGMASLGLLTKTLEKDIKAGKVDPMAIPGFAAGVLAKLYNRDFEEMQLKNKVVLINGEIIEKQIKITDMISEIATDNIRRLQKELIQDTKADETADFSKLEKTALEDENNMSFWFSHLIDIEKKLEGIQIPKTMVFKLPSKTFHDLQMGIYKNSELYIKNIFDEFICPHLDINKKYFLKNGVFSNKFDFNNCCVCTKEDIAQKYMNIGDMILEQFMHRVLIFGYFEIVVRELIPFDPKKTFTVYNGMPLRPETRIFYDFDTKQILYSVNYWDSEFMKTAIRDMNNKNDQLIFEITREEIQKHYEENKERICKLAEKNLKKVKGLKGRWSVDFMMDEDRNWWLIDMAKAENSTYYDEKKIEEKKIKQIDKK